MGNIKYKFVLRRNLYVKYNTLNRWFKILLLFPVIKNKYLSNTQSETIIYSSLMFTRLPYVLIVQFNASRRVLFSYMTDA
jgi:hypothetical protein